MPESHGVPIVRFAGVDQSSARMPCSDRQTHGSRAATGLDDGEDDHEAVVDRLTDGDNEALVLAVADNTTLADGVKLADGHADGAADQLADAEADPVAVAARFAAQDCDPDGVGDGCGRDPFAASSPPSPMPSGPPTVPLPLPATDPLVPAVLVPLSCMAPCWVLARVPSGMPTARPSSAAAATIHASLLRTSRKHTLLPPALPAA